MNYKNTRVKAMEFIDSDVQRKPYIPQLNPHSLPREVWCLSQQLRTSTTTATSTMNFVTTTTTSLLRQPVVAMNTRGKPNKR